MKLNKYIFLFLIVLFVLCISGVYADSKNLGRVKIANPGETSGRLDQDLLVARQLMAQGAYISAADYLEALLEQYPNDARIADLLIASYIELKAYEKAQTFLNDRLKKNPAHMGFITRLIDLQIRMGNDSLVASTVNQTIEKFPGNRGIYNTLIRILLDNGSYDIAMDLIARARVDFNQDDLFGFEQATVHENRREYKSAVYEILRASAKDSSAAVTGERKLALLIRFPGAAPEAIEALSEYLDSLPDNTIALQALHEAYSQNKMYDKAFGICVRYDSLSNAEGRELYRYMRRCRERKLYDQVIAIGDYMLDKNYENASVSQFRFFYAEALTQTGQIDAALQQFHGIIGNAEYRRDHAQAHYQIGRIYQTILNDLDSARAYYHKLNREFNYGRVNTNAFIALAEIHLAEGDLDLADMAYQNLLKRTLSPNDEEKVSYILAQMKFFRREYADAEMAFRKHIEKYPQGYYVNDALMHSLIIGENAISYPDALDRFADVELYEVRNMFDSMIVGLNDIREMSYSGLFGLANLKLAGHFADAGDSLKAIDIIDEMEAGFKDDYFYPYCLKLKGDMMAVSENNKEAAIQIYNILLSEYAAYPFTGEVRRSLQMLNGYTRSEDQT